MLRTHTCGQLRLADINTKVKLCGWVHKVRNMGSLCFVDIRDKYGITQLNVKPELYENCPLHLEDCIQIEGKVAKKEVPNKNLATGDIEILVDKINLLSKSETTPFVISENINANEDTRLKYRYLDLRRNAIQENLKLRHKINLAASSFLDSQGFIDVMTPTLVKSTPEGARDYLVPSRIFPGSFYALPQSPQIYKQLLMVGSVDKYYQMAICYRDEDLRADRQPEFLQLDVEMSFCEREDVLNIISKLLKHIFKEVKNIELPDFIKISYSDALNKYGSDKPDLRFAMDIKDYSAYFSNSSFEAYKGKSVRLIHIKNFADKVSRKDMDSDNGLAKKNGLHGVSHIKYVNHEFQGGISKFFTEDIKKSLVKELNLENNDLIIIGANESPIKLSKTLGLLRIQYADKLGLRAKDKFAPLFVVDWPLFEKDEEGDIQCLSNPFTRPLDDDLDLFNTDPTKIRSYSYDTVINGVELSSGALRTYSLDTQEKVFKTLKLTDEDIQAKFGFFIESLKYGTPPMGGFAIGMERLSMLLCETDNIREVVAFPKNLNAFCPMAQCPSPVEKENVDILGLEIKKR